MDIHTLPQVPVARNPSSDLVAELVPHIAAIVAILVRPAAVSPDEHLTIAEAARVSKRSQRMLRDAIRAGELPAAGRQKDRTVRRADLDAWIESRRVVHAPLADDDIERRVQRLAKGGAK